MLRETNRVDDELTVRIVADGFAKPGWLRIRAERAIKKDPAHEMITLPNHPHLLRRLYEIERLSVEQQLRRPARPAAGHRAERAPALAHQFIMLLHLRRSPGRQI